MGAHAPRPPAGDSPVRLGGGDKDLQHHFTGTLARLGGHGISATERDAVFAWVQSLEPPDEPARPVDPRIARGEAIFHDPRRPAHRHGRQDGPHPTALHGRPRRAPRVRRLALIHTGPLPAAHHDARVVVSRRGMIPESLSPVSWNIWRNIPRNGLNTWSTQATTVLMKLYFLLSFASLLGVAVSGCNVGFGCTDVGCNNGVRVVLPGLATKSMGALPLSIEVCAGSGNCVTAELTKPASGVACELKSGAAPAFCSIDASGEVNVFVGLPASADDTAAITVTARVTDSASAKVLDTSKSITPIASHPNGEDCEPTCYGATVSITS